MLPCASARQTIFCTEHTTRVPNADAHVQPLFQEAHIHKQLAPVEDMGAQRRVLMETGLGSSN